MSSSLFPSARLHHYLIISLMVLCSLGLFIVYYKPDIRIPTFDIQTFSQKEGDNHSCPQVLGAQENQTQVSKPVCPTEQNTNPCGAAEPDIIILIWMWPFGLKFDLSCKAFSITGCQLTDDKALYSKAHGVLLHHRDIGRDLGNIPKEPRPWFQKWVWFNAESPANSGQIPELNHLFNVTCNYRRDSNIPVPSGSLLPMTEEDQRFELPVKDKLVCWIVSNYSPKLKRVQFYNELKKYVKIEAYGDAFGRHLNSEEFRKTISSCKFYLSFENSIYPDYITEKLYNPMMMGTVPVVLGPARQNYEDYVPGDSFIHVDDFASPKELAERLHYLDQNTNEYMRYFKWRENFQVKQPEFGREQACRTCEYLKKHRGYEAFHNLNKWYWG